MVAEVGFPIGNDRLIRKIYLAGNRGPRCAVAPKIDRSEARIVP